MISKIPLIIIVSALLILVGCTEYEVSDIEILDEITTEEELKLFLEENQIESQGFDGIGIATLEAGVARAEVAVDSGAQEYSATNVQVEGVDEADFVKNDGRYIYTAVGNKVIITDAFPPENMKVISEIDFNDTFISSIYVNEDKLVVFVNKYGGYAIAEVAGIVAPGPDNYGSSRTIVKVYDISDRENPKLSDEFFAEGNYRDSRMIGNIVYVISNKFINIGNPVFPIVGGNGVEIASTRIFVPPVQDFNFQFTVILAIDLASSDFDSDVYLTGSSGFQYVSRDNIYLLMRSQRNYIKYQEDLWDEALIPSYPDELQDELNEIINSPEEFYERSREFSLKTIDYINSLEKEDRIQFEENLEKSISDFEQKWAKENEKTMIQRIGISELDISYEGRGSVPGSVLDQFAMDEFNGNFRIATTTGGFSGSSLNHLWVLDDNLEIIGSVEDLAPGERIFSARYQGDKAYIVTFRQVDPLYVIDLSDPNDPKVLGYLKVTGFSEYLQPFDENTLIGIGREATDEGRVQGVKISIFDVSDFENPSEIDTYEITEGRWSYSEALYDHKAVLFDRKRNLLVIPVSYSGEDYWQGAFVFNVNANAVELRGTINHDTDEKRENYYGGEYVRRSLFMDDFLYTISNKIIKVNSLIDLNEINFVYLPYNEPNYEVILY